MSTPFVVSYVALWALVLVQALLILGTVRSLYELRQGDALATPPFRPRRAPDFAVHDLAGTAISRDVLRGERAVLLFVSPDCPTCVISVAEVTALANDSRWSLVVVCRAEPERCRRFVAEYQLDSPVVADPEAALADLFGIQATPMAVRISADGTIESHGCPVRAEELAELLDKSTPSPEWSWNGVEPKGRDQVEQEVTS